MTTSPSALVVRARTVHQHSIVIDATCPGDYWRIHRDQWIAGGVTACGVQIAGTGNARQAMYEIAELLQLIRRTPRLSLATSVEDLYAAKKGAKLAVILHLEGGEPIEYEPKLLEVYWRLGVRVLQLAYNRRNPLCDGCEEAGDAGLSELGRRAIAEMNRLGVVVDVSHAGVRSSLESIERSAVPCIASHSNAAGVHANKRNLPDEVICSIAGRGGVIGINGFPSFVSAADQPTLDQLIDHIVYIDTLVGSGHVGLGIDYWEGNPAIFDAAIASGIWSSADYGPPPYTYPLGLERPDRFPALTFRLLERGFTENEVQDILGENWLRVYREVWK